MSTVAEIKAAIDKLNWAERSELAGMVWPDEESPPRIREKLAEAAAGRFIPGDRKSVDQILAGLE